MGNGQPRTVLPEREKRSAQNGLQGLPAAGKEGSPGKACHLSALRTPRQDWGRGVAKRERKQLQRDCILEICRGAHPRSFQLSTREHVHARKPPNHRRTTEAAGRTVSKVHPGLEIARVPTGHSGKSLRYRTLDNYSDRYPLSDGEKTAWKAVLTSSCKT